MSLPLSIDEWLARSSKLSQELLHEYRTGAGKNRWDENIISAGLLGRLEEIGQDITWTEHKQRTVWEGCKLAGTPEENYGDIAVLVTVWLKEYLAIEGVAFYEAKRQYFDNGKPTGFKQLGAAQLSKISKATTASHVLLYDHDGATSGITTAVPTAFVRELLVARDAKKVATPLSQELHAYGLPWMQRLGNNLRGFDLDFSDQAVKDVKQYVEEHSAPMVLLNAATTYIPQLTLELKPFIPGGRGHAALRDTAEKSKSFKIKG
ncbi:hypothetical protein [Ralstonia sp. ASV6]|uniref:hypothetical protein n=1 Tax=Ralstonia sp. ASV6 TaxID=2795124 RepID=UPI0018EBBB0F|nr:hypothetical protein [Ralstonia sp. ASV6]